MPIEKFPDMMSLYLLQSISQLGSVGRAAEEAGITQASASRRIANLERDLRLKLLTRGPTGSNVTEDGQRIVNWTREALHVVAKLNDLVDSIHDEQPRLHVAASMTVAEFLLPRWLVTLSHASKPPLVKPVVANSTEVASLLRENKVNIGFIESISTPSDLNSAVVGFDYLTVVVGPGHPWGTRPTSLTVDELCATRLIIREPGSGTRTTLEESLDTKHLAPPLIEVGSNAAVKIAVQTNMAPAVLSTLAVSAELKSGQLLAVPLADVQLRRPIRALWKGQRLDRHAEKLISTAIQDPF